MFIISVILSHQRFISTVCSPNFEVGHGYSMPPGSYEFILFSSEQYVPKQGSIIHLSILFENCRSFRDYGISHLTVGGMV